MSNEHKATYDPMKPLAPLSELKELIRLDINRRPDDKGEHWHDNYRLIENVVCRDSEVAQGAMDPEEELLYVVLTGDLYDVDELEVIDARLRALIGRVATLGLKGDDGYSF